MINTEPHNQSTCRKLETVKCSVLNGISVSHPLLSRFGDHCRRGCGKILRASPVENLVKLSIFWANKDQHQNPQHPWLHVQDLCKIKAIKITAWMEMVIKAHHWLGCYWHWWWFGEREPVYVLFCLFCFLPGISPWEATLTSLAGPAVVPVWQH